MGLKGEMFDKDQKTKNHIVYILLLIFIKGDKGGMGLYL